MMKNEILLLLNFTFILFCIPNLKLQAQAGNKVNKKLVKKYKSFLEKDSKVLSVIYNQTFEELPDGSYLLKTYNPDKMVMNYYVTLKGSHSRMWDGVYKEWLDNGQLWVEGQYKNNEKSGEWTHYNYPSRKISSQGTYENDKKEGTWIEWDTLGRKTKEKPYKNNLLDGALIVFSKSGKPVYQENYKEGELIDKEIIDPEEYQNENYGTFEMPYFSTKCSDLEEEERVTCSNGEWLKYVYGGITYPAFARKKGIEGQALFKFVLEKDGSYSQLETLRGVSKDIEKECLRILKNMPKWIPGKSNGENVRVSYNQPIRFKLE